jgi:hypothetical protein
MSTERQMCETCPFNPKSPIHYIKNSWVTDLDKDWDRLNLPRDCSQAHGCHEISDVGATDNQDEMCIGHLNWLRENG